MYICIIIYRMSKRSRGSKFATCGCAAPTADMRIWCVMRGGAGRPIAMCVLQLAGFILPTVLLRAWILQDLRRTVMRGYGVGGNEKGHAALAKRPNKGLRLCRHYLLSV